MRQAILSAPSHTQTTKARVGSDIKKGHRETRPCPTTRFAIRQKTKTTARSLGLILQSIVDVFHLPNDRERRLFLTEKPLTSSKWCLPRPNLPRCGNCRLQQRQA